MMNISVTTAASAEVIKSLEVLGYDQSLAEKIVNHTDEAEFDTILDAAGRLKAYVEVAPDELPRMYHLLHSQTVRNNYGAFKQLGFNPVPDCLLKICRYMSVTLKPLLPPAEDDNNSVIESSNSASTTEVVVESSDTSLCTESNVEKVEEDVVVSETCVSTEAMTSDDLADTPLSDEAYVEILNFIYPKLSLESKKKLMRRLFNEITE